MRIELLVLHRKESYPGENAPEVISVCDEWTLDENPQWWTDEIAKQKRDHEEPGNVWAVVSARLDQDQLMKRLYPDNPVSLDLGEPVQR